MTDRAKDDRSMFARTFSVIMTPGLFLSGSVATIIYFGNGVYQAVNGETAAAILWFLVWGHIASILAGAVIGLVSLAILAVPAACAAWLISLAWRLQRRGVDSLPFTLKRKR